jgi:hypothetical protein
LEYGSEEFLVVNLLKLSELKINVISQLSTKNKRLGILTDNMYRDVAYLYGTSDLSLMC